MKGWIKLHRKIIANPIFNDFQLYRLWTLCLLNASHKDRKVFIDKQEVEIGPGQWVVGRFTLFEVYNQGLRKCDKVKDPKTPYRWLEKLEKFGYVVLRKGNKFTVVTIVNWAIYQGDDEQNGQQDGQQKGNKRATDGQQMGTNKNVENDENEKEVHIYVKIIDFLNEKAETNYKSSTQKTRDCIKARINEGFTLEDFKTVIEYCCREWKGKIFSNGKLGDIYLKPTTLFNNKFDERLNLAKIAATQKEKRNDSRYKPFEMDLTRGES